METWTQVPNFDDENAKVRTKEHRASGAEITEVVYGAVDPEGNPTVPEKFYEDDYDDGHGTWTGIRLGDIYQMLTWKKPKSEGGEEEAGEDHRKAVLAEIEKTIREKRALVDAALANLKNDVGGSEAFAAIKEKWDQIKSFGVPKEISLDQRFSRAVEKNAQRIRRLESYAKNKLAKEELIKKAQEVADAGQWKVGSVKMKELMDSWKKLGFAGPEVNDQVWEAFQAARQTFYDRQRAWYEELDKKHAEAKEKKKAIIEEAKEVTTDTEEWNKTSEKLDQLFARWKEAGSAGRSDDDKLWSRFQEVRKGFYERRSAWFDERNARWAESAETKKSLIDEAREILESNDFSRAVSDRMKAMSQDWKAAGSAGHETDEGLWKKFREIQDAFWAGKRIDTENRHAQWRERMDVVIQNKRRQIADLIAQNKKLRRQADYSTSQEQIDQVYTWMDENDEKVKTLENDIEDIQKRLDEDN